MKHVNFIVGSCIILLTIGLISIGLEAFKVISSNTAAMIYFASIIGEFILVVGALIHSVLNTPLHEGEER
jgi:hypothetical protein